MVTIAQKSALALLQQAHRAATDSGLFDIMQGDCKNPDSINDVCDAVDALNALNAYGDTSMSGEGTCFLSPVVQPIALPVTVDQLRNVVRTPDGMALLSVFHHTSVNVDGVAEHVALAINAHAALLEVRAKYNRLHDALSAMFDAGSPTPDDVASVADMLAECVAADDAVALILDGK